MKFMVGVRHRDRKTNLISVDEVDTYEEAREAVRREYPKASAVLVSVPRPAPVVTPTNGSEAA